MAHGGTVTLLLQLGLRRYSDVATCCGVWSLSNMIILLVHGSFSIWIEYAVSPPREHQSRPHGGVESLDL